MFNAIKYLSPAIYLFGAVIVWYDFINENPDGLSNIWLIVYTYPIAYLSLFIFDGQLPIFSENYLYANAIYFWPSVGLISLIIFLLFYALHKFISRNITLRSSGTRFSSVRSHMRPIIVISIICTALAFLAGYFVASQNTDSIVAEHDLAALMHYTPALAYLQNGQTDNAKYILYVGVDGSLNTLKKNNAAVLSSSDSAILKAVLSRLNKSWENDKPFDTEKSATLRAQPEWIEMRQKNDAFRNGYANKE